MRAFERKFQILLWNNMPCSLLVNAFDAVGEENNEDDHKD